jgi:hypothetical protein
MPGNRHVVQEILPVHEIPVRIRIGEREVERVYLAPEGTDLPYRLLDGQVCTTVPRLDVHTMVVVETGKKQHHEIDTRCQWFDERWRRLLLEFNVRDEPPYLTQLDASSIADAIAGAGVNWCWVHAKDNGGTVFHDTKVGHKHSALGERNFLREFTEALSARHIRWGFHVNLTKDQWMYRLHPEWRQKWQDGSDRGSSDVNPDWDNMCPNSPHRDYNLRLIRELTEQFSPEAYWIDRLDWSGILPKRFACACDYCRSKFEFETGHRFPIDVNWDDPAWVAFLSWRSRCLTHYFRDVRDAIKSVNETTTVSLSTHNGLDMFGYWFHGQDPEDIAVPADHITQEVHAEREGYLALSLHPRFTRAVSGGKSNDADTFRHSGDLDFAFKPQQQLAAEVFTLTANGAGAMFEDLIYPEGRVEPHTYEWLRPICEQIAAREPWLGGKPVSYVGVYFSKNTRLHFGRNDPGQRYLVNFLGACKSLLEAHLPFEIVTDREFNSADLSRFRTMLLPNAVCLSDDQIRHVSQYVVAGGSLVSTFMTSLFDEHGRRRSDFGLADLIAARFVDLVTLPLSYLHFQPEAVLADRIPVGVPLLHRAPQARVQIADGGVGCGRIVYGQEGLNRLSSACHPPEIVPSDFPVAVLGKRGSGRTIHFAGQPDAVYAQWGHPEFKRLLVNAVRWAACEGPPLEVEAPMCVEATLYEQPARERFVAHLVNFQSELGRTFDLVREKFVA